MEVQKKMTDFSLRNFLIAILVVLVPGTILGVLLGAVFTLLAGIWAGIAMLIYAFIFLFGCIRVPKTGINSFIELLALGGFLAVIGSILGLIPGISSWLAWISMETFAGFFQLVAIVVLSLSLASFLPIWKK